MHGFDFEKSNPILNNW